MNPTPMNTRHIIFRLLTFILGMILLAAGVIKGLDLDLFARQIRQYGLLPDGPLVHGAAWFMVVAEMVVGSALVVNYRPKAALAGTMLMLTIFVGALAWTGFQGNVDDCGCFGPAAHRSPMEALVEDLLLLMAAGVTWRLRNEKIHFRHPLKAWSVAVACVMGLTLPLVTGTWHTGQPVSAANANQDNTGIHIQSSNGEEIDLNSGPALVVLMSTTCQHCQDSVPMLNEIVADIGETLPVYGIAAADQADIDRFIEATFAFYPVLPIAESSMVSLLGEDPFPKYLLIRDGQLLAQWKDQVPNQGTLLKLVGEEKGA